MGNSTPVYKEVTYPNGNSYNGGMKGKKRHGEGTYFWADDGTTYTGAWVNNEQTGYGVTTFKNGNKYEGQFFRNNINGNGKLTTYKGEVVEGFWSFKGRANNVPNSWNQPVAKYNLKVTITNNANHRQDYFGEATLHLKSGLLVLPNMHDPNESIFAAVVVTDADGKGQNFAVVDAVPSQELQQAKADGPDGIAYAQDPALDDKHDYTSGEARPRQPANPINPLDPRSYF